MYIKYLLYLCIFYVSDNKVLLDKYLNILEFIFV